MTTPIRIEIQVAGNQANIQAVGAQIGSALQQAIAKNANLTATLGKVVPGGAASVAGVTGSTGAGLAGITAQANTLTSRIANLTNQGGAQLNRVFNQINSGARQSSLSISSIGSAITGIAASIYTLERLGKAVYSSTVQPFVVLTKQIVEATEASRRFEYSVAGVAGGLSRARQLNRAIVEGSRNSPLDVASLRESALTLSRTPALSSRIGLGNPKDTAAEAERFASVVGRLGTLDPSQGSSGAQIAILNALQGGQGGAGLSSLRRRFGISPQTLAQLSGSKVSDLKSDPAKTLEAIEKFADVFIPPDAYERTSNLVSVRWQKVQDAVQYALAQVGDSGVFDSIGAKLKSLSDQMFDYFGSSDFQNEARRISDSLERILGNVAHGAQHLIDSITGAGSSNFSSVQGAVKSVGNYIDRIGKLTDNIPAAIDKVAPAIAAISSKLAEFMDAVITIADAARDPVAYARKVASGAVNSATGSTTTLDANATTLDALRRAGIDVSKIGTRAYDPKVNAGDTAYREARQNGDGFLSATAQGTLQTLRQAVGSDVQTFNELDFRSLPIEQRILAQQIYARVQQGGGIDPKAFRQLGSIRTGEQAANGTLPPRADEGPTASLTRQLIGREYESPNFQALLQAANSNSSGLTELAQRDQLPLEKLRDVSDVFGQVKISKDDVVSFSDLLKRVDAQFVNAKSILEKAIGEGDRELQLGGNDDQLRAGVNGLREQRDRLINNYRDAFAVIAQGKMESVREFSTGLEDAIANFPPEAKAEIQRAVMAGTTTKAEEFARYFGEPSEGRSKAFGIESMSMERAQRMYGDHLQTQLQSIQAAGQHGDILSLSPNASYGQISELKALTPDAVRQQQIGYLQGPASDDARDLLSRAQGEFSKLGDETSLANLRAAQVAVAELKEKIEGLSHLDPVIRAFDDFASSVRSSLESGIGDALYNIETQTGSVKDGLRSMAQAVLHEFTNLQAKLLVQSLVGNLGVQGAGPGGVGVGGLGGAVGGIAGMIAGLFAAKDGGIVPGHFEPIHKFADGGIVSRPTLGMVGEGAGPEAIIPLRHGSVPVSIVGAPRNSHVGAFGIGHGIAAGGSGSGSGVPAMHFNPEIKVFVVDSKEEAVARGYNRIKDRLIGDVHKSADKGGSLRKVLNRR